MSLFKVRDWWLTKPQSEVEAEEFDKGCMCIANIDNDPRGNGNFFRNTINLPIKSKSSLEVFMDF